MKPENEDKISRIMNDPEMIQKIIQESINDALLKHKQAGNAVCGWKNGKIFWLEPDNISVKKAGG